MRTPGETSLGLDLSVVIPTHNTREVTLRCVQSVQTAAARWTSEIVVVDDGGSDGTAEEIERLSVGSPRLRMLRHETAQGFTAAANRGLAEARGRIVLLLNSDTEITEDGLVRLLEAFERDAHLGIAGGELIYPDGSPQWGAGEEPTLAWMFALATGFPAILGRLPVWRRLRPVHRHDRVAWVSGAAMAIRGEALTDAGPFDTRFRFYGQDLDFCLRAGDRGWRVAIVKGFRVVHLHGATIGRDGRALIRHGDPSLLFSDLTSWAEKRKGRAWALACAGLLRLGAGLRIVARRLALPFLRRADRRETWRAETRALKAARDALAGWGRPQGAGSSVR